MALKIVKKPQEVVAPAPQQDTSGISDFAPVIDQIGKDKEQAEKIAAEIVALEKPFREQMEAATKKAKDKLQPLLTRIAANVGELTEGVIAEDAIVKPGEGEKIVIIGSKTDADKPLMLRGLKYEVEFSKMGNQRVITDMKGLMDILGEDTFWAKCKMDLKTVDDYATPEEKALVLEETKTARKFTKVEKKP